MRTSQLKKYAKLLASTGLNVKKGQSVFIQAGLDQPEFVAMVVEECYKAGAKAVYVEWSYQPVAKLNATYKSLETLSTLTPWEKQNGNIRRRIFPVACLSIRKTRTE